MPDLKLTFDPAKVKITHGEILADLTYPVRSGIETRARQSRAGRRRAPRR